MTGGIAKGFMELELHYIAHKISATKCFIQFQDVFHYKSKMPFIQYDVY